MTPQKFTLYEGEFGRITTRKNEKGQIEFRAIIHDSYTANIGETVEVLKNGVLVAITPIEVSVGYD